MSLLHEIQAEVLREGSDLAPILLKLRLLAARLGSQPLADWVKHESEGYPDETIVPDYRVFPVTYRGTFVGPFGNQIVNTIAPYVIEKIAGARWNIMKMRESIAAVDSLLANAKDSGSNLQINAQNLSLLLGRKVYERFECVQVNGLVDLSTLAHIRHRVRSRVLELTIEFEKALPEAMEILVENPSASNSHSSAIATQIFNQTIYGDFTSISGISGEARVDVVIGKRDRPSLIEYLKAAGIPEADATQFAEIVAGEEPESRQEPLGEKARSWLSENLKKAGTDAWKLTVSVATEVIKQAALKYYGL